MCRRLEGGWRRKGRSSLPQELGFVNSSPAVLRNPYGGVAEGRQHLVLV